MFDLSIAIPVFNNRASLDALLQQIDQIAGELKEEFGWSTQCVLVDDSSTDDSLSVIKQYQPTSVTISTGANRRNEGQRVTILHAWDLCRGERVITMSADLQDPPGYIRDLALALNTCDLCIGRRKSREDSAFNSAASRVATKFLTRDIGSPIDTWFDFFSMRSHVLASMQQLKGRRRFIQADVLRFASTVEFVDYDRRGREGKTGNNLRKRWNIFSDSLMGSTSIPIRLVSRLAVVGAFLSLVWSVVILFGSLFGSSRPAGWAPVMLINLVLGSAILLSVALAIGYLSRIYEIVRGEPLYLPKESNSPLIAREINHDDAS